jgi:hypothetical protein
MRAAPTHPPRAVWSECTIWVNLTNLVKSNLSVFGMLLAAADSDSNHSYFAIQVVSAIPLVRGARAGVKARLRCGCAWPALHAAAQRAACAAPD